MREKDQNLPEKNVQSNNSLENHFQIAIAITGFNHPIEISFSEDHQIDKIHKISRKVGIADQ